MILAVPTAGVLLPGTGRSTVRATIDGVPQRSITFRAVAVQARPG